MTNKTRLLTLILVSLWISVLSFGQALQKDDFICNLRYAPKWWQTPVNMPDNACKTMVGKEGQLLYEYVASNPEYKPNAESGYTVNIRFRAGSSEKWKSQQLLKPEVPLVITRKESQGLQVQEEVFTVSPLLFGENDTTILDYLGKSAYKKIKGHPGNDILLVSVQNTGASAVLFSPSLDISSGYAIITDTCKGKIFISDFLRLHIPYIIDKVNEGNLPGIGGNGTRHHAEIFLKPISIAAGQKIQLAIGISQGSLAIDCPSGVAQALLLRKQSIAYWESLHLPYNKISVPDSGIQALLNASVRNIYQGRESNEGLPAFQSGPTVNRKLLINDAPFIFDALALLNQTDDVKKGFSSFFNLQSMDGSFMQKDKDWKETGYALWGITNFGRLNGDKQWLESVWPRVEKGFNYLVELRKTTLANPKSPVFGLLPAGLSGNEMSGESQEYSNVYWALSGMNAAIAAARWAGRNGQAIKWQAVYDDFYKSFQESTSKNMKKDASGNMYLPIRMGNDKTIPPQKTQGAFLNAVYPGKIFDMNDPLLLSNMKILGKFEKEGLLVNTGWINNGISNNTGSDYANALLWVGRGQEAAIRLYAFANHASPMLSWCENQTLRESTDTIASGDQPNIRASAEFIRTVRRLIILERSNELHLLEGVPRAWTQPGMTIQISKGLTEFGTIDFKLKISDDGSKATFDLTLDSSNRRTPSKILVHLDALAGNPAVVELEQKPTIHKIFNLN